MKSLRSFPIITLILLLPLVALAQVATTTTSTTPPTVIDLLNQAKGLGDAFSIGGVLVGISAVVNLLVNATKVGFINTFIKGKGLKWIRPLLALVAGFLAGLIAALAEGKSWGMAIAWSVLGAVTGSGAVLIHELVQSFKAWRKKDDES